MTVLNFVLAFIACIATGVAGAFGMRWHIQRKRVLNRHEDPRDTQIRDLLAAMKIAKEDVVKARTKEMEFKEHVDMAHMRINELQERLDAANNKYYTCNENLNKEHAEKEGLEDKLKATAQQLENFKQRVQELEMEMSVGGSGDMLDPAESGQVGTESPAGDDEFSSEVQDSSPSLIQCLTTEMERWKRHCRVLGEELKAQRDKLVNEAAPAEANGGYRPMDDLTDIKGIGKVLARRLHDLGIYTFEQLAALNESDLQGEESLDDDFFRRMQRDDWVGQARAMQQSEHSPSV